MAMFRVATLLSFCLLSTSLHAVPSFKTSAASRFGGPPHNHAIRQRNHDLHLLKRALTNRVYHRAQPLASHVIHLFDRRRTSQNVPQITLPNIANRQGLIGEQCSTDADCQDPRQCITLESGAAVPCTTASDFCLCFSPLLVCSSEEDCDPGELCVDIPTSSDTLCVSEEGLATVNVSVTETGSGTVSFGSGESPLVDGLSGDSCLSDNDCDGSRVCLSFSDTEIIPCSGQGSCACLAEDPFCSTNADCASGEFCQSLDGEDFGICLVTSLVPSNPAAQAADEEAATTELEGDEPVPSDEGTIETDGDGPSGEKLNFEQCQSTEECAGTRLCASAASPELLECTGQSDCICMPTELERCTANDDCDVGESCVLLEAGGLCISENASVLEDDGDSEQATDEPESATGELEFTTEEPGFETEEPEFTTDEPVPTDDDSDLIGSETSSTVEFVDPSSTPVVDECQSDVDCEDGEFCEEANGVSVCEPVASGEAEVSVCISAHHLSHMGQKDLLYSTHRVARVLCDEHNSCATAGHMIKYKGVAMMMRSYCNAVGCTSKIARVNSPRYYPGKVVGSNSDDLAFTYHAARYNTRVEERMLQMAVRIGL